METNPTNEERIARLEKNLQSVQETAQKYKQDLEKLRQQYADDLFAERQLGKQLRDDRYKMQHDYEQLRVQKGGFGIKILTLSGFVGFLSGLLLCVVYVVFLHPKPDHAVAFEHFRNAHLFNYERSISAGKFGEVEQHLSQSLEAPEHQIIRPELEFAKKIVGAARRRCE
jgi:hypothetical protein